MRHLLWTVMSAVWLLMLVGCSGGDEVTFPTEFAPPPPPGALESLEAPAPQALPDAGTASK